MGGIVCRIYNTEWSQNENILWPVWQMFITFFCVLSNCMTNSYKEIVGSYNCYVHKYYMDEIVLKCMILHKISQKWNYSIKIEK